MVTEQDAEKALDYLRDSAEEYARWRAAEKHYENRLKSIEAAEFLDQEKGSVEAKRMAARASDAYLQCLEDYREAKYKSELFWAYRQAAQSKVSFFQTLTKTHREGF